MDQITQEDDDSGGRGPLVLLSVALLAALVAKEVISAFVEDIVVPLIGALLDQPTFQFSTVTVNGTPIYVGAFLATTMTLVVYVLVALVMVGVARKAARRRKSALNEQTALLREIRDALRDR
jgi:large conductance mechanosensitive channel